ncbi:CRISPR-associated helicase Cas3' [uncultured Propionibacterium sp.]|uniref:CRISPR-associated helicase Cas3' n=1 Tax=uncultured Propionibacterium sp. TaxID=218066 RepID=UPI00292CD77E|nr:CRISPR-associated helicase Cas3' [uncultured Propionibacterium sp.]
MASTAPAALGTAARVVWAKSGYDPVRERWLPLWLHLLDAAAVAEHLARAWVAPTVGDFVERELTTSGTGLSPTDEFCLLASWLAGVHDVGKCTPAFSMQVPGLDDRMREAGLRHEPIDRVERRKAPHALAGQKILACWLQDAHGWEHGPAEALASVVGAHHGIPATDAALTTNFIGHEHLLGDEAWARAQYELLELATLRTGAGPLLDRWARSAWSQPFLVELSGLVIVADWIASCEDYFPLLRLDEDGLEFLPAASHAQRARAGIDRLEIPSPWRPRDEGSAPDDLLVSRFDLPSGSHATNAQQRTVEAARTMGLPGLLIVGESAGGGKTEAALMAAEILAARMSRAGVLFALPTQATTDAMFSRELDWLARIEGSYAPGGSPSTFAVSLQHGRARLNREAGRLRRRGWEIHDRLLGGLGGDDPEQAGLKPADVGRDEAPVNHDAADADRRRADLAILSWFNGRKKSMLSDFVVTTVDHLLFAAMCSPHLALRHLGLSRKVVIVDEVHSYSTYMNVYLDRALTWLAAYGVPVVLLSATLSEARCAAMVDAYQRGLRLAAGRKIPRNPAPEPISTPFPFLVTADVDNVEVAPTQATGQRSEIQLRRLGEDADLHLPLLLRDALADGGCALVVRNTVRRAQETYEQLREAFGDDVSLNHARFTIADRLTKDAELLHRFGPLRKAPQRPHRAIVVATQVVEQSLDVDFDLLVTDLAPIDLVLQRMGRLHRHERPRPDGLTTPTCYVDRLPRSDDPSPRIESGAKKIYGEQDMLFTAAALNRVLSGRGAVRVPDDVHELIEAVYAPDALVPSSWQEAVERARAEASEQDQGKRDSAKSFLLAAPKMAARRTSLVNWLHTTASDDEERGRAQVRDGEDSLEVILLDVHREGGQTEVRTLPNAPGAPGAIIPTDRVPDPRIVRAMAMSMVRLPPRFTNPRTIDSAIGALGEFVIPEWQNDRELRGQLFLPLVEGRAELIGITLEYDSSTGLKEVPSE